MLDMTIAESGLTLTPEQRLEREQKGYWSYSYLPGINPEADDACWAKFNIRKEGEMIFGVIGPEPDTNHAYLLFIASGVPKATARRGAQLSWVEFQQNDDAPIRRRAQHFNTPNRPDAAMLAIGVPRLMDIVTHLDEGHRFRIAMDGREVFDVSVHSVEGMKKTMVECEALVLGARQARR